MSFIEKKKQTKSTLKVNTEKPTLKRRNYQRTPLEKFAVKQEKIFK